MNHLKGKELTIASFKKIGNRTQERSEEIESETGRELHYVQLLYFVDQDWGGFEDVDFRSLNKRIGDLIKNYGDRLKEVQLVLYAGYGDRDDDVTLYRLPNYEH